MLGRTTGRVKTGSRSAEREWPNPRCAVGHAEMVNLRHARIHSEPSIPTGVKCRPVCPKRSGRVVSQPEVMARVGFVGITSGLPVIRPLSGLSSPKVHETRWIFWLALTRARPTRDELHAGYGQRRQDKIGSHQLDRTFLQQAAETQFSGRRLQAKDGIANNFA